ncbi:MAG TPA: DivIVA domain-containing protein [Arthrobacter sp.]|nr:DivIVA domain-containing protein [Arthrobacter sp.]
MALTPEDVVNKRFQPTKFREGYDQDEVDDFLDEIVVELRRLNQENDELRKKLADTEGQPQTQAVPAPVPAAETAAPEETESAKAETTPEPEPAVEEAPAKPTAETEEKAQPTSESAAGVLAMAQRLHDEYVNAGMEQRDKIISEAQVEAHGLVNDAQEKSRKTLGELEQQRAVLERKVEQLRGFERDYRSRLKAYIEGQLRDLDARGSVASPDSTDNADA